MRPAVYLAWVAGTVVALAAAAIMLTVLVDPYRMFGTPTLPGWTELKPRASEQMDIAKLYQLERIAPRTLLLGNSRTEIGLDPSSEAWPLAMQPVFNAAEAGGSLLISLLMLRDALAVRVPESVVLGVDFQDFLGQSGGSGTPSALERRLLVDRSGHPNPRREYQRWQDRLASTLTIDAVVDSVMTLLDQDPVTSATMTSRGFNPLHQYRTLVARNGHHALFTAKMAAYKKQYSGFPKPDFTHDESISAYGDLVAVIKLTKEHRIPLVMYIHPYHAIYLEMLHELGLWPSFEAWKRKIVTAIVRESASEIQLFDFSGYDRFTTELVPPQGDRNSEMQWYWEPGHYNRTR